MVGLFTAIMFILGVIVPTLAIIYYSLKAIWWYLRFIDNKIDPDTVSNPLLKMFF